MMQQFTSFGEDNGDQSRRTWGQLWEPARPYRGRFRGHGLVGAAGGGFEEGGGWTKILMVTECQSSPI